MQPVFDKWHWINGIPGLFTKIVFPYRQRTGDTQPGLDHHRHYRREMQGSKPRVPRPPPFFIHADQDEYQPENDKGDKSRMDYQKRIGSVSVDIQALYD